MGTYLFPIKTAFITFPIAAFFLTMPFLIFQYRKYSYINWIRASVLYSMLLFIMTAYYLVILPLPNTRNTCATQNPNSHFMSLIPFTFVTDFLNEVNLDWSAPMTYIRLFKERAFLQVIFNFLLLMPLGIYLRYYFRRSWKAALLISFSTSLFFEVTQLTGLYGIYNCPYRLFDVDDLLLNTSGAMLGFAITPLITSMLPQSNQLDANKDLINRPVGFVQRFLALIIDWTIVGIASPLLFLIGSLILPNSIGTLGRNVNSIAWLFISICIYFMLIPSMKDGQTFGKWLLRIKVVGAHGRVTFNELFKRYALLYGVIGIPNWVLSPILASGVSNSIFIQLALGLIVFALNIWFIFDVLRNLFKRNKQLFYEKWSGTHHMPVPPKQIQEE
ncbi:permease [Paenibacillus albiflavus]|uniref:Permease n=1 Tax=Paenibacillus albiflavus TaxID=2545760 RepID=A0A4R4EHS0_9BACL|nr:VanZ family protein [Paenibacillus albiflavus]TCZ77728.1 permease [Paenibacillus albiflavus]